MAMTKVKNLQLWCKKMADGYRDVEVRDMAASWKSGLAFCAIIHRFRPDLIDYDSLSKENVFENNNLAFEVAEKELSIPAFLEAADMVAIRVPDRLSVVTYVSQYYNYFHDKKQLGGPGLNMFVTPSKRKDNKPSVGPAETKPSLTPVQKKDGNAEIKKNRQDTIGDKCSICHEKVYLMERHIENAKLYHRRCFRNSELSPQSKVFKRLPYDPTADKSESQSTKFRKIDNDTKKDTTENVNKITDFLKKHSDGKSKSEDLSKPDRKFESNKTSDFGVSSVPSWKTTETAKDLKTEQSSVFPKTDLKDRFGATATKVDEPKPKRVDLVNRFKELDERNLKSLNGASSIKPNEQNKLSEKTVSTSKVTEPSKQFPVPKPRQNIGKPFEKMDTSETVHPSPVAQKRTSQFTSGTTSKDAEIKSKAKQETKKTDLSRPKTPPNSHKSEFSLNLRKTSADHSPSPPPPSLPPSSPPRLPASQPPTIPASLPPKLDFNRSPGNSPRLDTKKSDITSPIAREKFSKAEPKVTLRPHPAPAKPPRLSEFQEGTSSPMDTDQGAVLSKAVVHEPSAAQSAVLVVPNRHNPDEEQKDKQVLGGLLKSLAVVRNKGESNSSETKAPEPTNTSSALNSYKTDFKVNFRTKDKSEEKEFGKSNLKPRPKTSFVSQSKGMFSDTSKTKDESQGKTKGKTKTVTTTKTVVTTTKTTSNTDQKSKDTNKVIETSKVTTTADDMLNTDSDMPEWKRKLEERKRERARPKSADLLVETGESSSGGILEWQKEAAKRKEARKGAYVDPEKVKVQDRNTNNIIDSVQPSRPLSPPLSRPLSPPQLKPLSPPQLRPVSPKLRPLSPPQRKPAEPSESSTHKHANGFKEEKGKLGKSKSPERSHVDSQNKTKAKDDVPQLKIVDLNKKKILFDNSTAAGDTTNADTSGKKKIGLAKKFVFEDVELKPTPKRQAPARPAEPPASPTSPRQAPHRPPPPKTSPYSAAKNHLSTYQIQKQLRLIDDTLTKLELKGRTLEDSIRNANDDEEDELMINWFELINDKNNLVRRECDLVYVSKQQELEIEQDKIEQQLRTLIEKPDHLKTEADRKEEEMLVEKKVDVVYQRNNIIDSIDEDRLRYLAEDKDIETMLQNKGFSKEGKDGKAAKKKVK